MSDTLRREVYYPHPPEAVWTVVTKDPKKPPPPAMTVTWTLHPESDGTRLILEQRGLEALGWWSRVSMKMGWGRMLKTLLPKVLGNVEGSDFVPGAITKRDYKSKTVPDDFAK